MVEFKGSIGPKDTSFTKDVVQKLGAIRSKLAIDYGSFFRSMLKVYTPKGPIYKELEAGLRLTNAVIFYMDTVLGRKGRAATEEEFGMMRQRLDELNAQMVYFSKLYVRSKKFKAAVDKLDLETGISLGHITAVSGEIDKEITEAVSQKESVLQQVLRASPSLRGLGTTFGAGMRAATFGPFTPMAELAWETVSGIRKERRERRMESQRRSWMSRFGPMGMDIPQPTAEEMYSRRRAGMTMGGAFDRTGVTMDPLSDFFNRKAYSAKWTREMLDSIKSLGGKKEDGRMNLGEKILEGSGIKSVLDKVSSSFGGLLPVIAGVGAALAAIFALWLVGRSSTSGMEKQMGTKAYENFIGSDKLGVAARPLHEYVTGMAEMAVPGGMANRLAPLKMPETVSPYAYIMGVAEHIGATLGSKLGNLINSAKASEQVVVPNVGNKSSHKDQDPLQDKLNRTDED